MKRVLLTLVLAAVGYYFGHASRLPHIEVPAQAHYAHTPYVAASTDHAQPARTRSAALPQFVSNDDLFQAIDSAKQSLVISAYTLSENAPVISHLTAAEARGVRVQLVLTGDGLPFAVDSNRAFQSAHPGMHVVLLQRPIHLKTVVIDHGASVFVTDRNFAGSNDLVLQLPSTYGLSLERAAVGDPHDAPPLTVTKGTSLDAEAALIDTARATVSIETESFGASGCYRGGSDSPDCINPVATALERAAARGVHIHLVVASAEYNEKASERRYVCTLENQHVIVNTSAGDQKLAVIDSQTAWAGSSNATIMERDQIDWGFTTQDRDLLNTIQSSINRDSTNAAPC